MRKSRRAAIAGLLVLGAVCWQGDADADAVVAGPSGAPPPSIDLRAAVAASPHGSVRWSRITFAGAPRVWWLVPARRGARVDWSNEAWLDALDATTRPRVTAPVFPPPCAEPFPKDSEVVGAWDASGDAKEPAPVDVLSTMPALSAEASRRGFSLRADVAERIADLYASDWIMLAFELGASSNGPTSSPTLRVVDSGAARLSFALVAAPEADVHMTVFSFTEGATTIARATDISPSRLTWGRWRSNYASLRASPIETPAWTRESSSHELLFDGWLGPPETVPGGYLPPLVESYFERAAGEPRLDCASIARAAGRRTGTTGRLCPPGAVARIAGGEPCEESPGSIDANAFACGTGVDDLALALAGHRPSTVFVTRFSGRIPAGMIGQEDALTSTTVGRSLVQTASSYESCPSADPGAPAPPARDSGRSPIYGPSASPPPDVDYGRGASGVPLGFGVSAGGCGSGTSSEEEEPAAEGCSSDSSGSEESESESCTSDTGDSSPGDESSSDDEGERGDDGWGTDSSGDDSGDDSGETVIEWGDDSGSDDDDASMQTRRLRSDPALQMSRARSFSKRIMSPAKARATDRHEGHRPKSKKSGHREKRKPSPVSRMALFGAALVLPLRRKRRRDPE